MDLLELATVWGILYTVLLSAQWQSSISKYGKSCQNSFIKMLSHNFWYPIKLFHHVVVQLTNYLQYPVNNHLQKSLSKITGSLSAVNLRLQNIFKTTPNMSASKVLKFGSRLKELRIHLCQSSTASQGVR